MDFFMNLRQLFTKHAWWGKFLGAFFGFLILGPVGAFFGILIGNFFDLGLSAHFTHPYRQYYSERKTHTQDIFFKATFMVMGHIAKSDGVVSLKEIQMAKALMNEFRLNQAQQAAAKKYFNEGKSPDFDLSGTISVLSSACRHNPALLKLFLDIQYRVASVEEMGTAKIERLNLIFRQLGFAPLHRQYRFYQEFSDAFNQARFHQKYTHGSAHQSHNQYSQHRNQTQGSLGSAYAILELTPPSNKQEVKKAYRRLMSRHHPDKLIAQGLPESMIKIANEKAQAISKAYEQICEVKGW